MMAYQQGDTAAFDILYKRHSGKVYGFLKNRLRDRAVVDDVFQSTFLNLHRARSKYDCTFPFLPWLFAVCRNTFVDRMRQDKRRLEHADSATVESTADKTAFETVATLPPEVESLSVSQRQAIELRYHNSLAFEEIAERLETSPSNARQLVSRAIRKLQTLMNTSGRTK